MGFMQSCPSYEVGSTAHNQISQRRAPQEGRVYLNMNEAAVCNGTVYDWRYCFDPDGDDPPHTLVLAMYRPQQNGAYQLVPGSYYLLAIDQGLTFSCRSTTLEPSEYFTVQENDVVAFCEPLGRRRVEVYFEQSGNLLQFWDAGGCSKSKIVSSLSQLNEENNRVFLLSALIGEVLPLQKYSYNVLHVHVTCTDIDECGERTHNCHENATCSDVVGGFNCTCNTGFTGNGTFCEGKNDCSSC